MNQKYNIIAIILHWLIALAIFFQLACGLWMVKAVKNDLTRDLAYNFYQYHKSVGLMILVLSIFRLIWRLTHKTPPLPDSMKNWEKLAANLGHYALYFFMIAIPFLGWAMVSTSSYGIPTIIFGLFEWPHITFLANLSNVADLHEIFGEGHELLSWAMIFLLLVHIAAALKHQFIIKDNLLKRMIP